ncbi:hypothetical protein CMUS01_05960 [Colletotrichum musicola]|uniref:Uncharacterized protein n=1 Tax=Colletotrichum musicola TaxID=2175873 RepID=A0A8H6KPH1_9PEZI|nr:hypothetical protein CMUS01_05960 [Colletotrichum musicola]
MHLKSLITTLALASTALADCYTFGRKSNYRLPDKNVLDIPEICRRHFMGDYAAGETKSLCVHDRRV